MKKYPKYIQTKIEKTPKSIIEKLILVLDDIYNINKYLIKKEEDKKKLQKNLKKEKKKVLNLLLDFIIAYKKNYNKAKHVDYSDIYEEKTRHQIVVPIPYSNKKFILRIEQQMGGDTIYNLFLYKENKDGKIDKKEYYSNSFIYDELAELSNAIEIDLISGGKNYVNDIHTK